MTDEQPPRTERPAYKGAPLEAERGPGLGCFWLQVVAFAVLFVLIPYGVVNGWPAVLTTVMLVALLVLALFVGQTLIFLLRLVSADRRSRRRPLSEAARPTIGDLAEATPSEGPGPGGERETAGSTEAGPRVTPEPPEAQPPASVRQ